MTPAQGRIKKRFERLVQDAHTAGLAVVADADAMGIRLIPVKDAEEADDLRQLGEVVKLNDACGGGTIHGDWKHMIS